MSTLTLKELRLIAENRNTDGFQNMSKYQLINLIHIQRQL